MFIFIFFLSVIQHYNYKSYHLLIRISLSFIIKLSNNKQKTKQHNTESFINISNIFHNPIASNKMKNQQTQPSIQSAFNNIQTIYGLTPSKQILCRNKNISKHACLTYSCQKYAFICSCQNCSCQKQHQSCLKLLIDGIRKNIMEKVFSLNHFTQQIVFKIQKSIDFLSNLKQKFINDLTHNFQFFGLSSKQIALVKALQTGNGENLTGKIVWQAITSPDNQLLKLKIQNLIKQIQAQLDKSIANLDIQIEKFFNETQNHLGKLNVMNFTKNQDNIDLKSFLRNNNLFKDSKVVKQDKISDLVRFFQTKQLKATQLLYRASQNQFSANKFYEKCSNIPNTITICETQFEKVIGGYTPLCWYKSNSNEYKKDQSEQSFLFSLTNNNKLTHVQKQNAICRPMNQNVCVVFCGDGNWDFFIGDISNQQSSCGANLGHAYTNSKYNKNQNQSFERFCGNPQSFRFKTKQWEVWKVQFA